MDFMMPWRMVYGLRRGEAVDQDVYHAAAWSAIRPLSARSVDIPDLTRGGWKTAEALGIVTWARR